MRYNRALAGGMEVLMTRMESEKITADFLASVFEGIKHTVEKLRTK